MSRFGEWAKGFGNKGGSDIGSTFKSIDSNSAEGKITLRYKDTETQCSGYNITVNNIASQVAGVTTEALQGGRGIIVTFPTGDATKPAVREFTTKLLLTHILLPDEAKKIHKDFGITSVPAKGDKPKE